MISLSSYANKVLLTEDTEEDEIFPINITCRLANLIGKDLLKTVANGDINETQRLIYEGAPFTADWLGTNPLHFAAQGNHVEICKILLRSGISANARTKVDRTPLHLAAYEGHTDVIELLMNDKAEIDETDMMEMTALHWACQNGHMEAVQTLLDYGADKNLENKFGLKPVDIAHQIGRFDIANILEEVCLEDPTFATQNLAVEMSVEDDNVKPECSQSNSEAVEDLEESHMAVEDQIPQIKLCADYNGVQIEHSLSDSMRILQEHGITLLPADDDNNILSTVMESGHSVVLTEVGKQLLDSVKAEEEAAQSITRNLVNLERQKFITVNSDNLMNVSQQKGHEKKEKEKHVVSKHSRNVRPVVMKKSKLHSVSMVPNALKQAGNEVRLVRVNSKEPNVGSILKELAEAKRTIETYKTKLKLKEAEVECYKQKLKLLGYS